jgi:hypothetical protein
MTCRSIKARTISCAAALVIVGIGVAGCTASPPSNQPVTMTPELMKKLQAEGATPDSVTPNMLQPDGTLKNGLLPEQWGDTS